MPTEAKPLFHPDALRGGLSKFILSPAAVAARPKLEAWAKMLASGIADKKKETELLPGFISDVFEAALGYTRPPEDPYTLKREALIEVDGKFADAGLGAFGPKGDTFVAVLEGKGPRDPLDRPFAGRKRSAVEQAALYALQLRIDWYLVTNLRETRLYYKRQDTAHYERFETKALVDVPEQYRRFVFLLGADRVVGPGGSNHLDAMLVESRKIGRELTVDYYAEYRDLRRKTFRALVECNPGRNVRELLAATQKILDRVLFISFCEDRRLLPAESVRKAYEHEDEYNVRPVWENFKALFRWVDAGYPKRKISAYNGGLFASDTALDSLAVPDPVCEGFKKLADYEYGSDATGERKLIDVEILGHIFEQSISDLEEMQRKLASDPNAIAAEPVGPTKRKREGAFYTPAFVTRYIVAETLGPVLRERFEAFRAKRQADVTGTAVRVLDNPRVFVRDKLNEPQALALVRFWRAWIGELEEVRVVDPSCGSGAFLIEAFDQLFAAYAEAEGFLTELGGPSLIDVSRSILTNNLFGMDLNGEAVEIARLSCWIKTAEEGKKLTALDANIVEGNSVRAKLIAADKNSAELIKPFVQGTHLRPWYVEESGEYLLAIKSSENISHPWSGSGPDAESVFARHFPAVHGYLNQHRDAAIKRTDQGRFWWELRSCDYWSAFEQTKIVWPDIGNYPRFSMDTGKGFLGNTGYVIPQTDYYLLSVLSSWATWFYLSKTAQPLRLRSNRWQYRQIAQFMENIPIPDAPGSDRKPIAELAARCGALGLERYQLETAVQHRLTQTFGMDTSGKPLGKLNEKAQEWWEQPLTQLGAALKQSFKLKQNPLTAPKTADVWEPYLTEKKAEVEKLRSRLAEAEVEINDRVYRLFKLTSAEIKLLQREVEH